jgi:hypothetical protein
MHIVIAIICILSLPVISMTAASCSRITDGKMFTASREAVFRLPVWPPPNREQTAYPDLDFWVIEYSSEQGTEKIRAGRNTASITLSLPENIPAAVQAWPVTRHNGKDVLFFHPAGTVYPYSLTLSWEDGFAADILSSLYKVTANRHEAGSFCSCFNWERLMSALRVRVTAYTETTGYYDPWLLNKDGILSAIAGRSFSVYKLKNQETTAVSLQEYTETVLAPFIPANTFISGNNNITLLKKGQNIFLYGREKIAVISLTATGKISLAIRDLPLYTGNK